MQKLRTPLMATSIYVLLIGLSCLSPSIVRGVYGYEVRDAGVLLVLAASFLGSGGILWGIASDPETHGGLAGSVVALLVIFIVFLLWGWARGLYTLRNVFLPLIIDIALVAWIWSARTKA